MDGITLRSAAAQGRWNHYEDPNPAGMWFLALRDLGPLGGFAVRPFEPGPSRSVGLDDLSPEGVSRMLGAWV